MTLTLVPGIPLDEANAWIARWHRHHPPARGCLFNLGAAWGPVLVGVAIIGRPVARELQDGWTAEVTRCCVALDPDREEKGYRNACSMLYGAAWRACRAMGYRRLVTYTLAEEGGAALRGAGWRLLGEAGGGLLGSSLAPPRRRLADPDEAPLGGGRGVIATGLRLLVEILRLARRAARSIDRAVGAAPGVALDLDDIERAYEARELLRVLDEDVRAAYSRALACRPYDRAEREAAHARAVARARGEG